MDDVNHTVLRRNFMKKSIFKGIFDLFMAILLFLMFDKMELGLKFHEIGGLVAISLFFLHILINRKWVVSITKNLFNKQISIKKSKDKLFYKFYVAIKCYANAYNRYIYV